MADRPVPAISAAFTPTSPRIIFVIWRNGVSSASSRRAARSATTRSQIADDQAGRRRARTRHPAAGVLRALSCGASRAARIRLSRLARHAARESRRAPGAPPARANDNTPNTPAPLAAGASGVDRRQHGFPFTDPQAALAAKYFIEGSRLDDGDERNMEEAAAAYRKALVIDPTWCRRSSTSPTSTTRATS